MFVVVDLETTGMNPETDRITEIAAVQVRGENVLAEFSTLVNPEVEISEFITRLTGITNEAVASSPSVEHVLPTFVEFARAGVLVAHNAPFDVGFLRAACARYGLRWPTIPVVDTVALARRLVSPTEVENHKLSTLAGLFNAKTTPNHRALDDARATVTVLQHLLARAAPMGVRNVDELCAYAEAL
ncbi:MAG: hypothetical protein HOQ05_04130 [Corynebacteriales bacterium]|nr:hypothetical protein [Mycobacteriales bacterium]